MVREQLIINGVDVPLEGSLNPALTFSIQDIKRLDKRKSTYSKTITLPGSKVLNDLFNFIFEINIDGTFNPNLKADAIYLVDSQTILDGFIQLKDIHFLDNSHIIYKCVLLGTTANLFTDLGDLELTDIQGLSDFDHVWSETEQRLSWDTSINYLGSPTAFNYGFGYTYPLLDYGKSTDLEEFNAIDLYPAFYVKELWDRIFTDAGYTYTSSFLNSSDKRFKRAIVPFNGDMFGMTSAQMNDRMFTADTPTFTTPSNMVNIYPSNTATSYIDFVDVEDAGNIHNVGVFTAPSTGRYDISAYVDLTALYRPDAPVEVTANVKTSVTLYMELNGSTINTSNMVIAPDYTYNFPASGGTYTTTANPNIPNDSYCTDVIWDYNSGSNPIITPRQSPNPPNRLIINASDIALVNGDEIRIRLVAENILLREIFGPNAKYLDINDVNYDGDYSINLVNTGLFKANQRNTEYAYLDEIDMYGCLPRNIKQKDFVMSIINMFNLFIEPDVSNPNNLTIEPREAFYNATVIDWSKKLDVSNDLIYKPMGLLDASRYIFSYKEDKDYYNEKYLESYSDIYGQREVIIENEFLSNTNANKIIFSPTPLVGQSSNDRVLSTIIKLDQYQQAQQTTSNIRYLIYDGLKATSTTWIHQGTTLTEYPYSGHFDDPFNPTVDANFGLPYELYYDSTYYTITVTNNSLYNEFHKLQIDEITDKDSKIVKGKFYLTPNDVSTLSFRNQYFFNNAYHRLLKVDNYNPSEVALTKCEFLKLKTKDKYTGRIIVVSGGIDQLIGSETVPLISRYTSNPKDGNSYNTRTTTVQGSNNIVDRNAKSVSIIGDNNVVSSLTKNIVIQNGANNIIESNVQNISLINTSGVTVTESNVTYINGEIKGNGSVVIVNSSFTPDESVGTYLCDTSTGDMNISLPATATVGKVWNFKKIAIDKSIRINSLSLIDGLPNLYIYALNNSYSVQFDGLTYKII
jgi:hypothetical protein